MDSLVKNYLYTNDYFINGLFGIKLFIFVFIKKKLVFIYVHSIMIISEKSRRIDDRKFKINDLTTVFFVFQPMYNLYIPRFFNQRYVSSNRQSLIIILIYGSSA